MRKIVLMLALAAALPAFSQSMKIVVDANGNPVGRYERTNAKTYTVTVQDTYDVPKANNRVVTYSAENGQGILYCKNYGKVNVRSIPSTSGEVIGRLEYLEGDMPESYDCLGKENGWYKLNFNGKTGYVRQDLLEWDGICTF